MRAFTAPTYSPYPVKYVYLTVMIQRNRPAVLNDLAHFTRCAGGIKQGTSTPLVLYPEAVPITTDD